MKKHHLTFQRRPATGRPPTADLSPAEIQEIQSNFLKTNRTKKDGSMLLAWVRFCEAHSGKYGHLVSDHMPTTTIPTAVVEACRQTRALIGADRGGAPRLRHESAFVPGTMRRHSTETRRLRSGERASVDDATRNVACWIPWPWGGCDCSEKYGVRLGRWQTLVVHDDASGFIPFISSVFRWHQSYRGTDAASVIYRAERDVLQFDNWSIEGGVWQSKAPLAVLAGRGISAKGRPNQKLVENYFGRLWTIMAGQTGDVGRHRGEIRKNSEIYVKCRAGKEDPRKHFMSLTTAQEALYSSVGYLNEKRIDSREYGKWVPKARWESDLAAHPRHTRNPHDEWLLSPVSETRTVRSGMLRVTADGPMGVSMRWTFADDYLWQFEGRKVTVYFDPMAEWPVSATITLAGSRKVICEAACINTYGESKDRAADIVKSIRQTQMTETRILHTGYTERTIRHNQGVIVTSAGTPATPHISAPDQPLEETIRDIDHVGTWATDDIRATPRGNLPAQPLQDPRKASAAPPRITRDDLADSLARKAARLRGETIDA